MTMENNGPSGPAPVLEQGERSSGDSANLDLLRLFAQLNGLSLDAQQLAHYFSDPATPMGLPEMIHALHDLEFDASMETGKLSHLAAGMLPLIAEGSDGRFLLLGRIDAGQVILQVAGERQPRQMSMEEFGSLWTGRWIKAARRTGIHEQNRTEAHKFGVSWFWQALRKYRRLMGEVLLASLFVQIFALITPLFFQVVIDKVLTHRSLSTLDVMVVAMVGVAIFEVVLSGMRHYLFSHTTNRIDVELGAKLFRHLMHLPLSFFESRRSGDTVARMRELENARNFLTGQALTSWLDLLFAVIFLGVMFYYSPTLTFVVLAALPIFFGASWLITPLLRKKLEDKFALGAENQTFLVETITAMETLKGQAVEPQWQRDWERRLGDYVNVAFHSGHLGSATNQFISLTSKLLTVILLWAGARLVIDGELTVGGLIAFNMLSGRVNAPILKLASLWQDFTQMKVSISLSSPADIDTRYRSTQVGVQLNIPIYSGGGTESRVREAAANYYRARSDWEAASRQAVTGAKQAFTAFDSGQSQIDALESAVESSRSSVEANKVGYRIGTRINTDVLNAEQQLATAQRDLVRTKYDTLMQGLKLKASGELADGVACACHPAPGVVPGRPPRGKSGDGWMLNKTPIGHGPGR